MREIILKNTLFFGLGFFLSYETILSKKMVIANTVSNLDGHAFSKNDYPKLFGIDFYYLKQVQEKLDAAGAQNYELLVLFSDIKEFLEVIKNSDLPILDQRYIGAHWSLNSIIASSLIKSEANSINIEDLVGVWRSGDRNLEIQVKRYSSILVLDENKEVWAAAKQYADGDLFSFVQPNTMEAQILNAVEENGVLYFSNGYNWIKQ